MSDLFISKLSPELTVSGPVEYRLLKEYGAMFVSQGVTAPLKVVFRDDAEVAAFQSRLSIASKTIGGMQMELQAPAMQALDGAIGAAEASGMTITPRGADSARRSYKETVALWASRVEPALDHWVAVRRLSNEQAEHVRSLSPFEQVSVVLDLETDGMYFAKDLSKSILYSVAPPGTSQHLSLLAFDVGEHESAGVRRILAEHRWFQTVVSDLPHFTYMGLEEKELLDSGLKRVQSSGRAFWVPDI